MKQQYEEHHQRLKRPPSEQQSAQRDAQQTHAASSVRTPPHRLMRTSDILALQRTVGNQAVQRILSHQSSSAVQRAPWSKSKPNTNTQPNAAATVESAIAQEHTKYVSNFATPLSKDVPTSYKVTVAVVQEVPEYLTFAKSRMKSTIRNKVREGVRSVPGASVGVRSPKTNQQIKEKAAIKAAGKGANTPLADPDVQRIVQNSDSVGHSWIKLSPVDASGKTIQTYSFGFVPANGAAHGPQQAIPGEVRNPDLEFEADGQARYLDTTVSATSYQRALSKIAALMGAPPSYMTIGYNCTQFTKDIAKAAGASFPSKAGMMIPISDRGFRKRALNPNALYEKLGTNLDTTTTSPERDMLGDPGKYNYDDRRGVYELIRPGAPKGMQLIDMSVDEDAPGATVEVTEYDTVIPTGKRIDDMYEVEYEGKNYYVTPDALKKHLKDQEVEARTKHTLMSSLSIKTNLGTRLLPRGRGIMVMDSGESTVSIDGGLPDRFQGKCSKLAFWQAVAGIDLDAQDGDVESSEDSDW